MFAKFTGKHLGQSLFFKKVAAWRKNRFWQRCFPVYFATFMVNTFGNTKYPWVTVFVPRKIGFKATDKKYFFCRCTEYLKWITLYPE